MLMPQSNVEIQFEYTGINTLPVTFPFFDLTSITLQYKVTDDTTEVPLDFVYGVDFTVSGVPAPELDETNAFLSGTVQLTQAGIDKLTIGNTIILVRQTMATQLYQYNELDNFPAKSHENALSRLAAACQELQQIIKRAVIVPPTSSEVPLEIVERIFLAEKNIITLEASATEEAEKAATSENNAALSAQIATDASASSQQYRNEVFNKAQELLDALSALSLEEQAKLTNLGEFWAIADILVNAQGSAKYWAEQASQAGSIASDEEYSLGTTTTKATNPKQVKSDIKALNNKIDDITVSEATEVISGKILIATQAKVNEGTDDNSAVTPKKLNVKLEPINIDIESKLPLEGGTIVNDLLIQGDLIVNGTLSCGRFILNGVEISVV